MVVVAGVSDGHDNLEKFLTPTQDGEGEKC